ncbi:hypothetical protein EW145_g6644 [Phellinidium pouzarii]|uniref:JmjC domain-containing protein n=1 Tax=Phellinidium pouzarii TaxID=167371 RepID=A0A4S4KVY7_9AGAM|nr:hypothetical protein EW145_g6644 [Phellinidium pouzarii]
MNLSRSTQMAFVKEACPISSLSESNTFNQQHSATENSVTADGFNTQHGSHIATPPLQVSSSAQNNDMQDISPVENFPVSGPSSHIHSPSENDGNSEHISMSSPSYMDFIRDKWFPSETSPAERNVAVFLMTPICASAAFYNPHAAWAKIIKSFRSNTSCQASRESIMASLYHLTSVFNRKLLDSITSVEDSERNFARWAFQKEALNRSNGIWYHGIFQALVLDRIYWASTAAPYSEVDERPLQTPFVKKVPISKATERLYQLSLDPFAMTILSGEMDICAMPGIGGVIDSLFQGTQTTYSRIKIDKAQNNFCFAALGLIALLVKSHEIKAYSEGNNDKKLGELLQQSCPNIAHYVTNLDDYELLRPLYLVAAISPICLLSDLQVKSNGAYRVPMYRLVQTLLYPCLRPDPHRRTVEWCLINVILNMAVHGKEAFDTGMARSIATLTTNNILNNALVCTSDLPKFLEWESLRAIHQSSNPNDYLALDHLSKTLTSKSTKEQSKEIIDLACDNPNWFTTAINKLPEERNECALKTNPIPPTNEDKSKLPKNGKRKHEEASDTTEKHVDSILELNTQDSNLTFPGFKSVLTVWRETWETLHDDVKRAMYNLSIDTYNTIPDKNFRQATLNELCTYRHEFKRTGSPSMEQHCLNFLDIPVHGSIDALPLDDTISFVNSRLGAHKWKTATEPTTLASRWMIAALAGTWTDWHSDASGLNTYMHIWDGSKVWYILGQNGPPPGKTGWEPAEDVVDALHLISGDDLYMHPRTAHAVLTDSDCIALGGHFYCNLHFHSTLQQITFEHFHGCIITNTEHTRSPLLIMKYVCAIVRDLRFPEEPENFLQEEQLFYAMILLRHLDQLALDVPSADGTTIWQNTAEFSEDFEFVLTQLSLLVEMIKENGNIRRLYAVEREYFELLAPLNFCAKADKRVTPRCLCGCNHDNK